MTPQPARKPENEYHDGNRFYILGEFNDDLQKGVIIPLTNKISELADRRNAEVEFYINSNGGDGHLCMYLVALFELAKKRDIKVKTIVPSIALSAGSILAVAGTKGERYIAGGAEHLVHYGQFDGYRKTTPLQIERGTERWKRWTNSLLEHYKKYCSIPELEEHLKDDDFWVPAAQCIEWGLADKYMEEL